MFLFLERPAVRERAGVPLAIVAVIACACVLFGAATVDAGITQTRHNLIGSGRDTMTEEEQSVAVCAFCHTPHGTDQSRPLWQGAEVAEGASFTTFDSFGLSNLENVEEVGSVSLACVSCHDGVQALNVTIDGAARAQPSAAGGRVSSMLTPGSVGPATQLAISHPVGIPYGAWRDRVTDSVLGLAAGGTRGVLAPDAGDQRRGGFNEPLSATIDGTTVWWLETAGEGRQRVDIHLYTRPVGTDGEAPYIECASCHDPHSERQNFLRGENTGSLCVSCHAL